MSRHTVQQHWLSHRGRDFHFVVQDGLASTPPTWFAMIAGKRWAVMPEIAGQAPEELDAQLAGWLDANVFA